MAGLLERQRPRKVSKESHWHKVVRPGRWEGLEYSGLGNTQNLTRLLESMRVVDLYRIPSDGKEIH